MLTLGIDTSGPACDVALVRDGELVAHGREAMAKGQDSRLPGLVRDVISDAGESMNGLDRIGVVTGPGSFTGVRVGVAFARGLALALKIPCIGVTALQAAMQDGQQGSAIVLLPAKRRPPELTFWAQRFRTGAPTGQPEEIGIGELVSELGAHPHFVYGEGLDALREAMPDLTPHAARPTAARAAEIAANGTLDGALASPVYVRAPDAALPGGGRP